MNYGALVPHCWICRFLQSHSKNKQSLDCRLTIFEENWYIGGELVFFQFPRYYEKLLKTLAKVKKTFVEIYFFIFILFILKFIHLFLEEKLLLIMKFSCLFMTGNFIIIMEVEQINWIFLLKPNNACFRYVFVYMTNFGTFFVKLF